MHFVAYAQPVLQYSVFTFGPASSTAGDLLISVAEYRTTFLEQAQRTRRRLLHFLNGLVVIWVRLGMAACCFLLRARTWLSPGPSQSHQPRTRLGFRAFLVCLVCLYKRVEPVGFVDHPSYTHLRNAHSHRQLHRHRERSHQRHPRSGDARYTADVRHHTTGMQ